MSASTTAPRVWASLTLGHLTVVATACLALSVPGMRLVGAAMGVIAVVFWALHRTRWDLTGLAGAGVFAAGIGGIVLGAGWPALGAVLAGLLLAVSLLALGLRETRYAIQGMFILALIVVVLLIEEPGLVLPALGVWVLVAATTAMLADDATVGDGQTTLRGFLRLQAPQLAVVTLPVLLLGLAAELLLPVSDGPARQLGNGERAGGGASRQAAPYLGYGPMDLSMRGELPNTPLARISADSPPLWRTAALSRYDGRRWVPSPSSVGQTGERTEQDTAWPVSPQQRGFDMLIAPGIASHAEWAGPADAGKPRPYRVWVGPYSPVEGTGGGLPGVGPDDPGRAVWTQLPPSVTPRTRALAQQIAGDTRDPQLAATRIAAHLTGGDYRYDLRAAAAGPGQDSVDFFLFASKAGFCEHYAAAEVVMLRSLGFPARVATGFRNGEPTDQGDRLIRASHAHAWVEVHVEGRGWVTADPTPAAEAGGFSLSGLIQRHARTIGWLALLAAPIFGGLGFLLLRRYGNRRPDGQPNQGGDELVAAVRRLREALAERGARPGHTLHDLAARAPEIQVALAVADTYVYSRHQVGEQARRDAVASLDRYTSELVAARRGQTSAPG